MVSYRGNGDQTHNNYEAAHAYLEEPADKIGVKLITEAILYDAHYSDANVR